VPAAAARESRVLLTFDKDFGEFAARSALPTRLRGLCSFVFPAPSSDPAGQRLAARIAERDDWNGHFSVVVIPSIASIGESSF
jgi:hypothetical protein